MLPLIVFALICTVICLSVCLYECNKHCKKLERTNQSLLRHVESKKVCADEQVSTLLRQNKDLILLCWILLKKTGTVTVSYSDLLEAEKSEFEIERTPEENFGHGYVLRLSKKKK